MNIDEDPITDSSGNGFTGTLKGAGEPDFASASSPAAYSDGYYTFDDNDDFINHGDVTTIGDTYTIVLWVKHDSDNDQTYLAKDDIGDNREFYLALGTIGDNDEITMYMFKSSSYHRRTTDGAGVSTAWYHIAVVGTGTAIDFWGQGTQLGEDESYGTYGAVKDGTANLYQGQREDNNDLPIDGSMTQVAIFTTALDNTDINDIMDNGLSQEAAPTGRRRMWIQ